MSTTHLINLPEWRLKKVNTDLLEGLQKDFDLSLPIAKSIASMEFGSQKEIEDFLNPSMELWHSKSSFPSLEGGAKSLHQALINKKRICIHGDFDTDGMLGSLVLKSFFEKLNAPHFCIIPKRNEGHGLSESSLKRAFKEKAELIISVDCGVNAISETEFARNHGVDVLITDHHLPDESLPNALAITNPQLDHAPEFKGLSGAGVALKLALATIDLFEKPPLSNEEIEDYLNQALVITAIATVADVMPLLGLNRALVKSALNNFDKVTNYGLIELIKLAKIKFPANVEDLSFQLIPRINSAQRMERGDLIWSLFNAKSQEEAKVICRELESLNIERKSLLEGHAKNVMTSLEGKSFKDQTAIFIEGTDWLEGFSGLIAQRVLQKYQKPSIVMLTSDKDKVVASCRSPKGWHLKMALDQCEDFLEASGGHAQAAGFRTKPEYVNDLKASLEQQLSSQKQIGEESQKLFILHELPFRDLNMGLHQTLQSLEPHGHANPKPLFACKGLMLDGPLKFMGKDQSHVSFQLFQPGLPSLAAIAFGMGDIFRSVNLSGKFDLVFYLSMSPYKPMLQLQVQGVREHRTQQTHKPNIT